MVAPTSVADLLELVRQSLPLDPIKVDSYVARLRRTAALPGKPGDLAALLVRDGFLTPFQADHLMRGRRPKFLIGKYLILDRIGAGGMGAVYLCEHLQMDRPVALKVLPADQAEDPAFLGAALPSASASVVGALNHPNIVQAFDVDVEGRTWFLVMEYVDGVNLQDLTAKLGRLDPTRAAHYVRQAARWAATRTPPERADSPRHQAGQPVAQPGRRPQGPRPGPGALLPCGRRQHYQGTRRPGHPRHGRLPRPGTGDQQPCRGHPRRHLQPGGHLLFPADRPAALRRRHPEPETPLAPDEGADAGAEAAPGSAGGDGGRRGTDAGEGRGRPLPDAVGGGGRPRPLDAHGPAAAACVRDAAATPSRPRRQALAQDGGARRFHGRAAGRPADGRGAVMSAAPARRPPVAPYPRRSFRKLELPPDPGPAPLPPVAPRRDRSSRPHAPLPPPTADTDDWSLLFDDTGNLGAPPLHGSGRSRRGGERSDFQLRRYKWHIVGAGAALLLLGGGVWLVLAFSADVRKQAAPPPAAGPGAPEAPCGPNHLRAAAKGADVIELTWDDPHADRPTTSESSARPTAGSARKTRRWRPLSPATSPGTPTPA